MFFSKEKREEKRLIKQQQEAEDRNRIRNSANAMKICAFIANGFAEGGELLATIREPIVRHITIQVYKNCIQYTIWWNRPQIDQNGNKTQTHTGNLITFEKHGISNLSSSTQMNELEKMIFEELSNLSTIKVGPGNFITASNQGW